MRKAKLTEANYKAIRDHLFDRIHKTGQDAKNDFPNILRTAIETEAWKHFTDGDGKPFANLVAWLHYSFPLGLGMGQGRHVISYEDALQLTEGAPDVHRVLAQNAPKGKPGRKKTCEREIAAPTQQFDRHRKPNGTAVLSARLAQEKPTFYEAYLRGEYKTITAAAMAAGLLRDDGNLRRAKSAFRKMTSEQRAEFLAWIDQA
jgi:hypothetical protein